MELRVLDGLNWPSAGAAPALWTGLTYHRPSRLAAWELLRDVTAEDLERVTADVAVKGLAADISGRTVHELAGQLLELARQGLAARVEAGVEPEEVIRELDPLYEVLHTGLTPAERLLDRWNGEFDNSPARYVRAYRI